METTNDWQCGIHTLLMKNVDAVAGQNESVLHSYPFVMSLVCNVIKVAVQV